MMSADRDRGRSRSPRCHRKKVTSPVPATKLASCDAPLGALSIVLGHAIPEEIKIIRESRASMAKKLSEYENGGATCKTDSRFSWKQKVDILEALVDTCLPMVYILCNEFGRADLSTGLLNAISARNIDYTAMETAIGRLQTHESNCSLLRDFFDEIYDVPAEAIENGGVLRGENNESIPTVDFNEDTATTVDDGQSSSSSFSSAGTTEENSASSSEVSEDESSEDE